MAPERERPTRREMKEGRPVQRAAERLAHEADRMEQRSRELGAEIEQARSDWQRKRADESVTGASPPGSKEGPPEEASGKEEGGDSGGENGDETGTPEDRPQEG